MTDKVQKIREEVEKLKSQLIRGACSSQIAMETRCKEEAYNEVLAILDTMQEESVSKKLSNVQRTVKNWKEPVSDDLEEASKEWLKPQLDKSYADYGETKMMELTHFDGYAMLDAIEFGAKWKEKKMMRNAIDVTVHIDSGGYPYIPQIEFYDYDKDVPLAKKGDKYKVVLIKE
jgi:hypothetical protein